MSRSAKPCGGIKLIYYTSIKQRERSCFRQLNFLITQIKELAIEAPHAYIPFHPAVKSSQPRDVILNFAKLVQMHETAK